jgi:hypothetical protein
VSDKVVQAPDQTHSVGPSSDPSDARVDAVLSWIERGLEPIWESQKEMARAFVTLSAGTIVLSVSMAQFVMSRAANLEWIYLLPIAWVCLSLCLVAAITLHELMGVARAWRAFVEVQRILHAQLEKTERGPEQDQVDNVEVVSKSATDFVTSGTLLRVPFWFFVFYWFTNGAVYFLFVGGLAAIVAFTIKNIVPGVAG